MVHKCPQDLWKNLFLKQKKSWYNANFARRFMLLKHCQGMANWAWKIARPTCGRPERMTITKRLRQDRQVFLGKCQPAAIDENPTTRESGIRMAFSTMYKLAAWQTGWPFDRLTDVLTSGLKDWKTEKAINIPQQTNSQFSSRFYYSTLRCLIHNHFNIQTLCSWRLVVQFMFHWNTMGLCSKNGLAWKRGSGEMSRREEQIWGQEGRSKKKGREEEQEKEEERKIKIQRRKKGMKKEQKHGAESMLMERRKAHKEESSD